MWQYSGATDCTRMTLREPKDEHFETMQSNLSKERKELNRVPHVPPFSASYSPPDVSYLNLPSEISIICIIYFILCLESESFICRLFYLLICDRPSEYHCSQTTVAHASPGYYTSARLQHAS